MRIWDITPKKLCRPHLLGEHRELHAIWSILTNGKKGYANHPEVVRWRGKLAALYKRHGLLVKEMTRRGYRHQSPLQRELAIGKKKQGEMINTYAEQIAILTDKRCGCKV